MRTTLVQQQSANLNETKASILQLLEWDAEQYGMFVYATGMKYLFEYFAGDERLISYVALRKEFWNWFKTQWYYRDQAFIETFEVNYVSVQRLTFWYKDLHNPSIMAAEISPNRIVLGDDFPIKTMAIR